MITLETRLTIEPRVRFRRFESEGIVVNQQSAEALVVSDVATRVLELADGARTLRECASMLVGEFDAETHVVEADLVRFASELVEAGVVRAT